MKKLITFLVITFFAQLGFAQDYTMSIKENYLVLTEVSTGIEKVEIPRKDARAIIRDGIIKFYDAETVRTLNGDPGGYDITSIETDGAVLSEDDLRAFLYRETGFNAGSGATGTAATVSITSPDGSVDVINNGSNNFDLSVDASEYIRIDLTGDFSFFNFAVVDELLEGKTLVLLSDGLGPGTRTHTFGSFNNQQTATTTDGEDLLFSFNAVGWNCLTCESVSYTHLTLPTIYSV